MVWRRDEAESDSVGIMFGAALLPLIIAIGLAIDYSTAVRWRSKVSNAADAAALAGARAAVNALDGASDDPNWQAAAKAAVTNFYKANVARFNSPGAGSEASTSKIDSVDVSKVNGSIVVTLDVSGAVPTSFMRVMGIKSIPIAVNTKSSSNPPSFVQINFIIDNSGSMGIGATDADQQTMYNATGCTIACHYDNPWGKSDSLAAVRASGALLRIDVVKAAAAKIIKRFKADAGVSDQLEIGIYKFSNTVNQVQAPTTDLDAAVRAIDTIDLEGGSYLGGTNITYSMSRFADAAATGGDGTTSGQRKIYTVLLTDGLEDSILEDPIGSNIHNPIFDSNFVVNTPSANFSGFETLQAPSLTFCDPVKSKKHQMLVMNVDYLVPTIEWWQWRYSVIRDTLKPLIGPALTACASNQDYVFNASTPAEIDNAADTMYKAIALPRVRLTN